MLVVVVSRLVKRLGWVIKVGGDLRAALVT